MRRVIALVAGETSGDQLGAALIHAIRQQKPSTDFVGIGGPAMKAAGLDSWWDSSQLSVMGLVEVVSHLPRLLKLRRQLVSRLLTLQPDVFIGIDAPDFNLGIEKKLRASEIKVLHYVSPTIWAWRPGRVKTIAEATERVLCLFPFEPVHYLGEAVSADYTGHPLADQIPLRNDSNAARKSLRIEATGKCVALLPGSRDSEVTRLTAPMLAAADILHEQYPGVCFLLPAATETIRDYLSAELGNHPHLDYRLFSADGIQVMTAADVVVCASGTATLEAMLVNRPMVVCYRVAALTLLLVKQLGLLKGGFFSLPNILASEALVPELAQQDVNGPRIAKEVSDWLDQPGLRTELGQRFDHLHRELRTDAAATAATIVLHHIKNAQ